MKPSPKTTILCGAVAAAFAFVTACSTTATPSQPVASGPAFEIPQSAAPRADPDAVKVTGGTATTLDLGDGAHLIIPPGAMMPGATVRASYQHPPSGTWDLTRPGGRAPVELTADPPNSIHGLLTLEFPVPATKLPGGVDPAAVFGVSTLDEASNRWLPQMSVYDSARQMVVSQIPHFSWWYPSIWNWDGLIARVNQDVGQLLGKRASAPSCSGGPPRWLNAGASAGIQTDAAVAVRSCVQAKGDVLDVQITNNRPYGMILTYGSPVKWGWHEAGNSALDVARNQLVDRLVAPNELYLPPLGRASVGIKPLAPGKRAVFKAGLTRKTFLADVAAELFGDLLLDKIPMVGDCGAWVLTLPFGDISVGGLRDAVVAAGECLLSSYKRMVIDGKISPKIAKMESTLAALKNASIVGRLWTAYGIEWKLADLWADSIISPSSGDLGAGFSILAKQAEAEEPAPASPAQPANPNPAQPAPPVPPAQPVAPPNPPASNPWVTVGTRGFHIVDSFYWGTWARRDTSDGTWHTRGSRPGNSPYWFPNGLGVAVDCLAAGAAYRVVWAGGRVEYWSWWAHVTDNTWVPTAVLDEAAPVDGDQGMRHC